MNRKIIRYASYFCDISTHESRISYEKGCYANNNKNSQDYHRWYLFLSLHIRSIHIGEISKQRFVTIIQARTAILMEFLFVSCFSMLCINCELFLSSFLSHQRASDALSDCTKFNRACKSLVCVFPE